MTLFVLKHKGILAIIWLLLTSLSSHKTKTVREREREREREGEENREFKYRIYKVFDTSYDKPAVHIFTGL